RPYRPPSSRMGTPLAVGGPLPSFAAYENLGKSPHSAGLPGLRAGPPTGRSRLPGIPLPARHRHGSRPPPLPPDRLRLAVGGRQGLDAAAGADHRPPPVRLLYRPAQLLVLPGEGSQQDQL